MKTTAAQFKYFCERCRKWQAWFGFTEVTLEFRHKNAPGARAWFDHSSCHGLATIGLAVNWDYRPDNDELDRCAFHEVFEIMLVGIETWCRCTPAHLLEEERHHIVRRMENTVWPTLKGLV